jgi:hypothetical protein
MMNDPILLASDTVLFGSGIAELVADKLQKGCVLGYRHRDFCGMAMKMDEKNQFLYGELYDGIDFSVPMVFKNRELFVTWLSEQSTASLARLDDDDFYRANQVITRQRLLEFIKG